MSEEKLTTNVLILELSTMIVAIALAFNAESLNNYMISLGEIINYVIVNVLVIWFWWRYIRDRFKYPIKTDSFPLYDVLLLIIISLIPEVLRSQDTFYLSGTFAVLAFLWFLMLRDILKNYEKTMDQQSLKILKHQIKIRFYMGIIFLVSFALNFMSRIIGQIIFALIIFMVIYNELMGKIVRRHKKIL